MRTVRNQCSAGGICRKVTDTADEFKANISAVFIAGNTFRIIMYSMIGVITPDALKHAVLLSPIMPAGLFAGMKSARIPDEKPVRKLVIFLLIISGIVLIINNIS